MLQFIGRSPTEVPAQVTLTGDEFIIGRDQKCSLVLDSVTSPRMISRVHVRLTKTQPASAALIATARSASRAASRVAPASPLPAALMSPQPHQPRWLLTDAGSVNGCFCNDIKVSSTLLSHGDVITIGGLGQKVPIGTAFPQPDAEFIFMFMQPTAQAQAQQRAAVADSQDATLPLTTHEAEAQEEEKHHPAEEDASAEDAPTQVLPPDPAPAPASARRPSLRKKSSCDMVDATFANDSQAVVVPVASLPRTRSRSSAAAAAAPHALPLPRTFSAAPTQLLSDEAPAPMQVSQQYEIHVIAPAAAAPAAPAAAAPVGAFPGLHAYRSVGTIDASMDVGEHDASLSASLLVDGSEDGRPTLGVRAMSIDGTLVSASHEVTQVLDSSQAATQVLPAAGAATATASISASLLGELDGLGMMTQTQVLPAFDRAPSATTTAAAAVPAPVHETPVKAASTSKRAESKSDWYDDEEEDAASSAPASSAAAAAALAPPVISLLSPSPSPAPPASAAASASPKPATPLSSSKKRGRHSDAAEAEAECAAADEEEFGEDGPAKKARVGRYASTKRSAAVAPAAVAAARSAMEPCPLCEKLCAASELEAHVDACLVVAANEADEAAARKLAAELEAADAAGGHRRSKAPSLRKDKRSHWREKRSSFESDEDEDEERYESYDDDEYAHEAMYSRRSPAASSRPAAAAAAAASSSYAAPAASAAAAASGPTSACPLCSKQFLQSALVEHADVCEGPDEECDKCQQGFLPSQLAAHKRVCRGPPQLCAICEEFIAAPIFTNHIQRCVGKDGRACELCSELCPASELEAHTKRCAQRAAELSQDERLAMQFQRGEQRRDLVNDMQTNAIKWVAQQAEVLSAAAYEPLLARVKRLGYTEKDLKSTIRYIRNDAPLIIHVNLTNCMKFFLADTHYRNQFETKTSCGTLSTSARTQWENGLFNKIYARASGFERVKYGVLNIVQDPNGVLACRSYGDSYLLLRSETIRLRTSFASRDTGGGTAKLASCESYCHVLLEYSDPELEDVIQVGTRRKRCVSSARISSYKEVQYHGPVDLKRDVEALVVARRHASDRDMMNMVEQFRIKNGCNVVVQEEDGH